MRPPSACCHSTCPVVASSAWNRPLPPTPTQTRPPAVGGAAARSRGRAADHCDRLFVLPADLAGLDVDRREGPRSGHGARKLLRPRPADLERAAVIGTDLVFERLLRY